MRLEVGPYPVDLIEDGDGVCRHQRGLGFEPRTRQIFARLVQGRGTVVDVGAYTGLYAIAAAVAGCAVHAIEPMPNVAQRLVENVRRNGARVTVHEAAAWSVGDQLLPIRYNPRVALTSGASLVSDGDRTLKVLTLAIDALALPALNVLKIDAERAEAKVVEGALATIARCRPVIIAEVLEPALGEELRALLPGHRCAEVMDERNWLFVPDGWGPRA